MKREGIFSIGAFAIILDTENRVLLCHRRDYDLWNLPGGAVEAGETPWEAVVREVKEEVGLVVEVEKLTGVYAKPDKNGVVFSFFCKVVGGEMTLTDEADQIDYFSLEDIPQNTSPKQVERVREYLADPQTVFFRTEYGLSSIELLQKNMRYEDTKSNDQT